MHVATVVVTVQEQVGWLVAVEKLTGSATSREDLVALCLRTTRSGAAGLCGWSLNWFVGNNACATRGLNHNRHDPKNCLFWSHGIAITRIAHVVTDSRVFRKAFPRLGEFSAPNADDSSVASLKFFLANATFLSTKESIHASALVSIKESCQDT